MDLRAPIWAKTDLLMGCHLQVRRHHRSFDRVYQAKNLSPQYRNRWTSGPEDAEGQPPGFRRFRSGAQVGKALSFRRACTNREPTRKKHKRKQEPIVKARAKRSPSVVLRTRFLSGNAVPRYCEPAGL